MKHKGLWETKRTTGCLKERSKQETSPTQFCPYSTHIATAIIVLKRNISCQNNLILMFCFCFLRISFIRERQRERGRDTGRGRSRLPAGARWGPQSWNFGIMSWAKGRCSTAEPPRHPKASFYKETNKNSSWVLSLRTPLVAKISTCRERLTHWRTAKKDGTVSRGRQLPLWSCANTIATSLVWQKAV